MSIDAALSRIDQIVGMQQQLLDPTSNTASSSSTGSSAAASTAAASATAGTGTTATTSTAATDASDTTDFADELAAATQASSATGLTSDGTGVDSAGTATSSPSLGESNDSALLSLMSSLSGGTAATSSDDTDATTATGGLEAEDVADAPTATTPVQATSPTDPRITAMTQEADSLVGEPYVYGGGHDGWGAQSGYDCSGFVSKVLHAGGYLSTPQDTTSLPSAAGIESGPGQYVTIYDRAQPGQEGHVIIDIGGQFYESGGESGTWGGGGGVEKIGTPSASYLATFNDILHPAGL